MGLFHFFVVGCLVNPPVFLISCLSFCTYPRKHNSVARVAVWHCARSFPNTRICYLSRERKHVYACRRKRVSKTKKAKKKRLSGERKSAYFWKVNSRVRNDRKGNEVCFFLFLESSLPPREGKSRNAFYVVSFALFLVLFCLVAFLEICCSRGVPEVSAPISRTDAPFCLPV